MRKTIAFVLTAVALIPNAIAQAVSPIPTSAARSIRLSFAPPPLDGTISLGVYDAKGKLVRVLFREADINEFNIGSDSLSTTWDGKDDAGENVPPGKYSAHGFVVGDLKIEGVGFFFNDWITSADGPRFWRIQSLAMRDENLLLAVALVPPGEGHVLYDVADKSLSLKDTDATTTAGESGTAGRDGTRWVIEGGEVKQLGANGEFLRRLRVSAEQSAPKAIAASLKEDRIYLLEENEKGQRVRALIPGATKANAGNQPISEWKVDFEKSIVAHKNFSVVDGKPVTTPAAENVPDKVKVKLLANPLLNDDRVTVEMVIGFDDDGSFIKAADGLPLCTISDTQNLSRALLVGRGPTSVDVFQDDRAVVEQFRISGLDQIMSFDCGGFELK